MKYQECDCGVRVVVPGGGTGVIVSYQASFFLSLSGGGISPRSKAGLKATVKLDEGGEREFRISSLERE